MHSELQTRIVLDTSSCHHPAQLLARKSLHPVIQKISGMMT